jgi:ribonuclease HII
VDLGKYEAPAPTDPVPADEIAEEGVMIAASAVRMAVKNRQIVRALRDRADYSEKTAVAAAREVFRQLAREKRDEIERIDDILEVARDRPGRALHQTDYRKGDTAHLEKREEVSEILADRLDDLAEDDDYLLQVVRAARDAAWDEIAASIIAKLMRRPELEASTREYRDQRAQRIRELVKVDLPLLEASSRPEY